MRKDIPMGAAGEVYSRRWRRFLSTGSWRAAVKRQFHKAERQAAKRSTYRAADE